MGLYVQSQDCTKLVALGKIHDGPSTIHCVAYANDVVRVSVEKVIDGEAEVPLATSEIKYVRDAINTFIAWPLPLVKLVSNEDMKRQNERWQLEYWYLPVTGGNGNWENEASLAVLPDLLMELDSMEEETTLLTLIEGVLAANIVDWGSRACVDLYHKGTIIEIYRISHN
ncbi:hypothetical protein JHK87_024578 [Glycine soja]|nr:hypothetical protein JHK87_024578 [Glycine soja]